MRFPAPIFAASLLLAACAGGYDVVASPSTVPAAAVEVAAATSGVLTSVGDTRTFAVTAFSADGQVIAAPQVVWSSSAPEVATVVATEHGAEVTAVGNGTALITATSGA